MVSGHSYLTRYWADNIPGSPVLNYSVPWEKLPRTQLFSLESHTSHSFIVALKSICMEKSLRGFPRFREGLSQVDVTGVLYNVGSAWQTPILNLCKIRETPGLICCR